MAETPKRSLKETVASTVEGRSPRFLLASLALAMVISLLAGLGLGMRIEQGRDNTKKAKPVAAKPKPKPKPPANALLANAPVNGVVVSRRPKLLIVSRLKRNVAIALVAKTRTVVTTAATRSEITPGSRVLFALKADLPTGPTGPSGASGATSTGGTNTASTTGSTTGTRKAAPAAEIIIVSGTNKRRLGSVVSSVTSDTIVFRTKGKTVRISITGAKILKTIPGVRANITKGRRVFVKTYLPPAPKKKAKRAAAKRRPIALEILVLPRASAFG